MIVKKWNNKLGIDYPKSYPNAVVKYFKGAKLSVLNICDNFVSYDFIMQSVDEDKIYLIADVWYNRILYCKKSLWCYFIVNELLKLGIKIRCLGYVTGFITSNCSVATNARMSGFKVDWEGEIGDRLYVWRNKSQTRLSFDNCLLNQSVIWYSILNLMEIRQYIDNNVIDYEITGANTDAMYILCNKTLEQKNNGQFYDKMFKIDEDEYKDCKVLDFEDRLYPEFGGTWTIDNSGSHFNYSIGGSTKTTSNIIENKDKRILGLAFENYAVCYLKMVCEREKVVEYKCMTIQRALGFCYPVIEKK